jgi:hypothetical protein
MEKVRYFLTDLSFKPRPEVVGAGNNLIMSGITEKPLKRPENDCRIFFPDNY